MNRLVGAAQANLEDAGLWRWYADLMEDRRIAVKSINDRWVVTVDHEKCAANVSFDTAIREAFHWTAMRELRTGESCVESFERTIEQDG